MAARSEDLGSAAAGADPEHHGLVRFAALIVRGNLRLLLGMIRANHPTRVMARLSRPEVKIVLDVSAVRV